MAAHISSKNTAKLLCSHLQTFLISVDFTDSALLRRSLSDFKHRLQSRLYFESLNHLLANTNAIDILSDSQLFEFDGEVVMAVKLRLKRMGRKNAAFFRLNAMDSRSPRDGRVIEELGYYNPREKDPAKQFLAKLDRCKHWLDIGAIPSETVSSLLKKNGLEHKHLRLPKPGKPKPAAPDKKTVAAPATA